MIMMNTRYSLLLLTILTSACASTQGQFPTLEKRPFETAATENILPNAPRATADRLTPDLSEKVAAIDNLFNSAVSNYAALLPEARRVATGAAGSAMGSENWVNAQLIVSRLDGARADAALAQSQIDQIMTQQLDSESRNQDPLLSPLIAPLQQKIAKAVVAQNEELERLARQIGI
jgi:hypothetical protein